MAQQNVMDVSDDGYETDATADTILVGDGDDGYTSDEIRQINEYYDQLNDEQMTLTPPRINRGASANANANDNTHRTPPTRLLTNNTQMSRQVYKMVIQPDGTLLLVPFTSDDYRSGQQPFDINGHAINREELPYVQPRRLFEEKKGDEKEGGASKSRSKRRRAKKSLRKRKASRKRKTNKRRKTRSKK
jgi:hypothetical protein